MDRYIQVILLVYIYFVFNIFINFGDANEAQTIHRHRRYLGFRNSSQFFVRVNFKANMVPWNQLFAQAVGYRMNWNEPPDSFHPHRHLSRRDLYNELEVLLNRKGLNGFQCVRRSICEVNLLSTPKGIYFKILQMVFRNQSSTMDKWYKFTDGDCQQAIKSCPFSMLEISAYTDL